ncbi:MAG: hypothetical protein ABW139_19515 [Candidatus Thiodiazotropha sp. DIVDIV]
MYKKQAIFIAATLFACFSISNNIFARNCIKGKPCGNGCIAKSKSCRKDLPATTNTTTKSKTISHAPSVIRRSFLKLPKVYQITIESVQAVDAPQSKTTTGHYKQGQKVFVYTIENGWARISNMQPEEWVELKSLTLKRE